MRRRRVSWPQVEAPVERRDDTANDDRMRTLIEVSRASGIPMPEIARLQREHPEELPAVAVGAALFFPEGIIPTVQALAEAEKADRIPALEDSAEPTGPSQSKVGAQRPADPSPPPPPPEPIRARNTATKGVSGSPTDEAPSTGDDAALAARIERLDRSLRSLSGELADLTAALRRPPKAFTSSS
jgi:hypothetical protein